MVPVIRLVWEAAGRGGAAWRFGGGKLRMRAGSKGLRRLHRVRVMREQKASRSLTLTGGEG